MLEQNLSCRSQLYFFGTPDKKRLLQLFLQRLDCLADGGLGDIELLARLGKAEGGCNIIENFIQFVIDIHGSSFLSERCSEPFCSVLTIIIRPAYKTVK